MRPVREITSEEENFRIEGRGSIGYVKRDPVEPEPVGTIILKAFRVTGYDQDCDGSLMARLAAVDCDGHSTGWKVNKIGLYPSTCLVVTRDELRSLFASATTPTGDDASGETGGREG